tara:strand:+ start:64 stop:198 length:135 start_codon:yes stop_codon:yes gene_type:complete
MVNENLFKYFKTSPEIIRLAVMFLRAVSAQLRVFCSIVLGRAAA